VVCFVTDPAKTGTVDSTQSATAAEKSERIGTLAERCLCRRCVGILLKRIHALLQRSSVVSGKGATSGEQREN
jgi:hypothetical protein